MEPEKKINGALMGIIVIIILLIVGGLYVWQSKEEVPPEGELGGQVVSPTDEENLDALEQEMNSVDAEIGASVIEGVE